MWDAAGQNSTVITNAETLLNCCGWDDKDPARQDQTCGAVPACESVISQGVDKAFNGSGGLGLFFAFTEVSIGNIPKLYPPTQTLIRLKLAPEVTSLASKQKALNLYYVLI